ncbi:magnesium transporter [Phaeosphaeriaceae sp. PMI808]|nr:magnesium transporter [Phaeosphaeriaceae sp. PMI808]
MAFLGTILNTVGTLFLTHAYAFHTSHNHLPNIILVYEHTTASTSTPLPTDITLELLFSIFVLSTGIVVSSQALRPIESAKWAGKISREGQKPEGEYTREGEAILSEGDPYAFLGLDSGFGEGQGSGKGEGRRGFWDVKSKRKEYEDWVRSGSKQ